MTLKEIQELIASDEHRRLELKKSTGELKDGMRSACAFLNTEGGWLIFGITPVSLKIVGEQVTDNTQREISEALSGLSPAVDARPEYIDVPEHPGNKLIAIHFDGWTWGLRPYTYHGCPYYRVESTTRQMPWDLFEERIRESTPKEFAWENQPAREMTVADLNESFIYNAVRGGVRSGRMPESALAEPVDAILKRWNLLKDGVPVNGAFVLFAKNLSQFPQLSLRMARFRGIDMKEFIDSKWENGNFFELLDFGMAFCFKHMNLSGKIKGLYRVEQLEIPVEALREALINCFCHRRYDYPNETSQLAIYDDRVEIANTGHFPPGVTPENIKTLHVSRPHNPNIAQVLYKANLLENWGSGIQRMIDACTSQGVPEPEYNLWADGTIVIVFRKKKALEVNAGNESEKTSMTEQQDVPQDGGQGGPQAGVKKTSIDSEKQSIDSEKQSIDSEKQSIDSEKQSIDSKKPSIGFEKPSIVRILEERSLTKPTKKHIIRLYNEMCVDEVFGRSRVMEITELSYAPAGALLKQMQTHGLIEVVLGHGKGKYRFRSLVIPSERNNDHKGQKEEP